MSQKNFFKNVSEDIPEWVKMTAFIISIVLTAYLIGRYAPFTASLKQALIKDINLECTPFAKNFTVDCITGLIIFLGLIFAFGGIGSVVYLLYCTVAFFIIEYRISKLPDDYFTRYSEITPEGLCSLLDVFHFHGHRLSSRPSFLEHNMKHIQLLMKYYTAEQIEIVKQNAAAKGYFYFRFEHDKEDGWLI